MGQYFYIANLDKKEWLNPHTLGMGLKLWEICANRGAGVLPYLLRKSDEGGGGDQNDPDAKFAGRWAGDRIVVIGDYDSSNLYEEINKSKPMNESLGWRNISLEVRKEYEKWFGEKLPKRWDT